jgi:bidirectional [NiFe] hydrogenase diaphorase subunit
MAAMAAVVPDADRVPEPAFFARQVRIATENSGRVDPESLGDYLAADGYAALRLCLTSMTPPRCATRSPGAACAAAAGAGYPTGLKWNTVAKAPAPASTSSATQMRETPARSWTGASSRATPSGSWRAWRSPRTRRGQPRLRVLPGRVPARRRPPPQGDPPGRAERLPRGVRAGHGVRIRGRCPPGAGAFVCGEETALIASIEGGREHRVRDPRIPPCRALGSPDAHQQTSRPTPTWRPSSATAATGSRTSAPRRARAPRCSPWRVGW